jgi:hypothetical protein
VNTRAANDLSPRAWALLAEIVTSGGTDFNSLRQQLPACGEVDDIIDELQRLLDRALIVRAEIRRKKRAIGFLFVATELGGYVVEAHRKHRGARALESVS